MIALHPFYPSIMYDSVDNMRVIGVANDNMSDGIAKSADGTLRSPITSQQPAPPPPPTYQRITAPDGPLLPAPVGRGQYRGRGGRGRGGGLPFGKRVLHPVLPSADGAALVINRAEVCPQMLRVYLGESYHDVSCLGLVAATMLSVKALRKRGRLESPLVEAGDVSSISAPDPAVVPTIASFAVWPDTTLGDVASRVAHMDTCLAALMDDFRERKQAARERKKASEAKLTEAANGDDLKQPDDSTATRSDVAPKEAVSGAVMDVAEGHEQTQPISQQGASPADVESRVTAVPALEILHKRGPPQKLVLSIGCGYFSSQGLVAARKLGDVTFNRVDLDGSSGSAGTAEETVDEALPRSHYVFLPRSDVEENQLTLGSLYVRPGNPIFVSIAAMTW